jgi:hypothetical protein
LGLAFDPQLGRTDTSTLITSDNPFRIKVAQMVCFAKQPKQSLHKQPKNFVRDTTTFRKPCSGGQLAFGADSYLYIALGDGNPMAT